MPDTVERWKVAAGDPTCIFVPGMVKPIACGSKERAAQIVRAVNAHSDLKAALEFTIKHLDVVKKDMRHAIELLAKAGLEEIPTDLHNVGHDLHAIEERITAALSKVTGGEHA